MSIATWIGGLFSFLGNLTPTFLLTGTTIPATWPTDPIGDLIPLNTGADAVYFVISVNPGDMTIVPE